MVKELCKVCNQEVTEPSHYWKEHRIKQSDYYFQYFPKKDLFSGEPLKFKSQEQYFSADFNNRDNLKSYLSNLDKERIKTYCTELFKNRKEYRGLKYAPTQVELRSSIAPPVNYINKYFSEGYNQFCSNLGYVTRLNYDSGVSVKVSEKAKNSTILIDTREVQYVNLDCQTEFATLNYGDYALIDSNLSKKLVIERKSLSDFIGTFGKNVERFENEVTRAAEDGGYILVVVEEDLNRALKFNTLPQVSKKIKVSPDFIFHNVRELLQRFTNLQFVFVPNRKESARIIKKALFTEGIFKEIDVQYCWDLQLI